MHGPVGWKQIGQKINMDRSTLLISTPKCLDNFIISWSKCSLSRTLPLCIHVTFQTQTFRTHINTSQYDPFTLSSTFHNLSPIHPSLHLKAYLLLRSLHDRLNSLISTIHMSFHLPCLLIPRLLYTDHSLPAPHPACPIWITSSQGLYFPTPTLGL